MQQCRQALGSPALLARQRTQHLTLAGPCWGLPCSCLMLDLVWLEGRWAQPLSLIPRQGQGSLCDYLDPVKNEGVFKTAHVHNPGLSCCAQESNEGGCAANSHDTRIVQARSSSHSNC